MPAKKYSVEQIIAKLREHEKLQGQGLTVVQACKRIGISDQTFFRWRTRYAHRLRSAPTSQPRRSEACPGPVIFTALESGVLVALSASLFRRDPEIVSFARLARSAARQHYRQSGVQGTGVGRHGSWHHGPMSYS